MKLPFNDNTENEIEDLDLKSMAPPTPPEQFQVGLVSWSNVNDIMLRQLKIKPGEVAQFQQNAISISGSDYDPDNKIEWDHIHKAMHQAGARPERIQSVKNLLKLADKKKK